MEHLRVATYEIKTGDFQDVAEKARHGMLKSRAHRRRSDKTIRS